MRRQYADVQIRGIQQLVSNLDRSVGQVSLETELLLRDLTSGASLDAGMVKRLAKAAAPSSEFGNCRTS